MSQTMNLKELERKAFRSTHQDGLWDLYLASLIAVNAAFFSLPETDDVPWAGLIFIFLGISGSYLLFWLGKKYITTPRLGRVKFGPKRQKDKRCLGIILGCFVLAHLGIFLLGLAANRNPGLRAQIQAWLPMATSGGFVLGVFLGIWLGTVISVIAYFWDMPRGYYIAVITGLGFFFSFWLEMPGLLFLAAAAIALPGMILFARFVQNHPLPSQS